MYGLFQTTFYFGYMALFSLALGIMCGQCSVAASRIVIALEIARGGILLVLVADCNGVVTTLWVTFG